MVCLCLCALGSACGSGGTNGGSAGRASTSDGGAPDANAGSGGASAGKSGSHATSGDGGAFDDQAGAAGASEAGAPGMVEAGGEGGGDHEASCTPGVTYGGGEASLAGTSVTAAIVDENGAPVASQITYICGLDLCSNPVKTNASGNVSLQFAYSEKRPAFKYGDSVNFAEFAVPLLKAATDFTTGAQSLASGRLSDKPGATLSPGSDAKSGDVTVSVPTGGLVSINTLVFDTAESQKFRAVEIPLTHLGPVLASANLAAGEPAFALVYGVAPSGTLLCAAAKVTVTLPHETAKPYNDLGWAPGTAVEFWITTVDVGQEYAPYAGWAKASNGVVSADGASVRTSPGEGFLTLENFALRKAP